MVAPLITAIIPSFNEEKNIRKCLRAIIKSAYPKQKIQILVVDGGSTDKTIQRVQESNNSGLNIKILHNKKRHLAAAWNLGIRKAEGKYIFAMNAHASVHPKYFHILVRRLEKGDVVCCGACMTTRPQEKGPWSKAIAMVLSSKAGVGDSKFRTGVKSETIVDSVHMAGYQKKFITKMKFNEELIRSQDIDFNTRVRNAGGKILLLPQKLVTYYTRSNINKFPADMFKNGFWVTRPFLYGCFLAKPRHLAPLILVSAFIIFGSFGLFFSFSRTIFFILLIMYFFFLFVSVLSQKNNGLNNLLRTGAVLVILHFSYGLGSLAGLFPKLKAEKSKPS